MPFWYDIKVPEIASARAAGSCKFVKWLAPDKSEVKAGANLAILSDGEVQYLLRIVGPGFLSHWDIKANDDLHVGQTIGRMTTDGELIPYGRPYVELARLPRGASVRIDR